MTDTASISIRLRYPPPAPSTGPPSTLAQVKTMVGLEAIETRPWYGGLDRPNHGAEALADLLEHVSARHGTPYLLCQAVLSPAGLNALAAALAKRRSGLRLSLDCMLDGTRAADLVAMDPCGGAIVQIQWRLAGPLPPLEFFKAASHAGVWNHLCLDGTADSDANRSAIAGHPDIIHSWQIGDTKGLEAPMGSYGRVPPLPGRPLWSALDDVVARFMLVDRLTRDRLMRLRIDADGRRLYTLGEALDYHFVVPEHLPDGYLDQICTMVTAGGTVATTHLRANLERAHLIGYVLEKGVIVGNSCLKNPRPAYIESVRRRSGLDLTGFVERGYTSVRPQYRGLGIGTRLLEGLTRRAGQRKIFSVIGEDNAATKIIARRNGSCRVATYFSQAAGKPVGIWMPEWMIDADLTRQALT